MSSHYLFILQTVIFVTSVTAQQFDPVPETDSPTDLTTVTPLVSEVPVAETSRNISFAAGEGQAVTASADQVYLNETITPLPAAAPTRLVSVISSRSGSPDLLHPHHGFGFDFDHKASYANDSSEVQSDENIAVDQSFGPAFSKVVLQQILEGKAVKVTLERETKLVFRKYANEAKDEDISIKKNVLPLPRPKKINRFRSNTNGSGITSSREN